MAFLKNLGNHKNFGLLLIRAGLGILFIYHGLPKLIGGPSKWEHLGTAAGSVGIHFLPTFWGLVCALTETLGGVLVIVGLAFRPACILLVLDLIVAAIFTYHVSGGNFLDATHAIEDAVVFAGLVFVGPGKYSVDKT
ncbi:MAG TPA: DoxX family protein [Puia sp.]|jgi:putative oxidoreductase|nr:DoxX family protein [Puia sp.]